MGVRPYVVLSCAVSVDGYLDDAGPQRLILSSEVDLDRVDEERARADAIFVGANTVRRDDPRLVLRSPARRTARVARGVPPDPAKVTVTRTGDLDPDARFFTVGTASKLVYAASPAVTKVQMRLGDRGSAVDAGDPPDLPRILADLSARGVRRLMVEGGSGILSWFLSERLADELHLVQAPLFVGDSRAPRWLHPGTAPGRVELLGVERLGDCVLVRYALGRGRDG